MARRVRVLRRVSIRRTIAAPRPATLLARSQVHPRRTNLHTLFADALLGEFDFGDSANMRTSLWRHNIPPGSYEISILVGHSIALWPSQT